jgi:hypothetical protein
MSLDVDSLPKPAANVTCIGNIEIVFVYYVTASSTATKPIDRVSLRGAVAAAVSDMSHATHACLTGCKLCFVNRSEVDVELRKGVSEMLNAISIEG